jgi:hypothetical protein
MAARWEYLFVTAEFNGEWRIHWKNDTEIADWETGLNLFAASNTLGDEGWALVATPDWAGAPGTTSRRLIFKRPKE